MSNSKKIFELSIDSKTKVKIHSHLQNIKLSFNLLDQIITDYFALDDLKKSSLIEKNSIFPNIVNDPVSKILLDNNDNKN